MWFVSLQFPAGLFLADTHISQNASVGDAESAARGLLLLAEHTDTNTIKHTCVSKTHLHAKTPAVRLVS